MIYLYNTPTLGTIVRGQVVSNIVLRHCSYGSHRSILLTFSLFGHFRYFVVVHNCFQIKLCLLYQKSFANYIKFYMNQMEEHSDTNVVLTRKSIKPSIAKVEEPPHSEQGQHTNNHERTPSNFIIKSKKIQKKRKPLPIALLLSANYSCGCSLKSLSVQQKQDTPFQVVRVNRFPNTIFEINQITEKSRSFVLISNFLGTKYNLFEGKQNQMSISFAAGFCNNSASRQFSIYMLAKNVSYSQLKKIQDDQDLQEIYSLPENEGKISKLNSIQPRRSLENGDLHLNFTKKNVLPAVQNAVVTDESGQQAMEIIKFGENQFEVSCKHDIPKYYALAMGIASLDFKWAIQ